ncbi:sigma factor [Tabrizicola sp.]|uniref:sigma factor n=1 Tax=Tabrizicola sp. TaxID=2005166 RepID=UPI001A5373C8|nr:sigma factor [Tabrizicola sp.]MBL9075550.1 sigD protein [Tabrizicola sp.]
MTAAFALSPRRDCAELPASVTVLSARVEGRVPQDEVWEVLLARANDGDGAAFARFLQAVTPTLRTVIRRRGDALPPDQHEDILQEVLLAIHLKRKTWRRDAPVRPWLYALARYKVVDAFRRRGTSVTLPIEEFAEVLPEESSVVPLSGRDTEMMLGMIDARSAMLVRAVALDGKTAEEAGETVGMTAGAARVALHRAMRRLSGLAERMMK